MRDSGIWRDLTAVTFSVAVLGLGVGSTLPLTALTLNARGYGADVVGWMLTAIALGGIGSTLLAPRATLRFGRRNVMLGCVLLAAVSVVPLQFVHSLWGWGLLRGVFGAAMAPLFVLGEAWINDLPSDAVRGRVVAAYTTSFTLCQILGPLLADVLWHSQQRAFVLCGVVFLLGLPGIAVARERGAARAPPATGRAAQKDTTASWRAIVRKAPSIIAGVALFSSFDNITLSLLPLFVLDHGLTQDAALHAAAFVLAGDAALQIAAGWLADLYGRHRIQLLAAIGVSVLLPLLPLLPHVPLLWPVYLFVLGGLAGSLYTLSMTASGEIFSGAALLRASGLIALTWNVSTSVVPAATGALMRVVGSDAIAAVLWLLALGCVIATLKDSSTRPATV